jgi:hypothetical protein
VPPKRPGLVYVTLAALVPQNPHAPRGEGAVQDDGRQQGQARWPEDFPISTSGTKPP